MKKRTILFKIILYVLFIPLFIEAQVTNSVYYGTDPDGNSNFELFDFKPAIPVPSRTEPVQMPGWPINIGTVSSLYPSGICLADIYEDGLLTIIAGSPNGAFHVWNYLGNDLPGWPKTGLEPIRAKAAVGDIDPDYPGLEIVVAGETSTLYVWDKDRKIKNNHIIILNNIN